MKVHEIMAVRNRVKDYIAAMNITPYEFAKKTGVAKNTVYNLCNYPSQIPAPVVMDKIYKAFPKTQPNDLIAFVPDSENSNEAA